MFSCAYTNSVVMLLTCNRCQTHNVIHHQCAGPLRKCILDSFPQAHPYLPFMVFRLFWQAAAKCVLHGTSTVLRATHPDLPKVVTRGELPHLELRSEQEISHLTCRPRTSICDNLLPREIFPEITVLAFLFGYLI